MISAACFRYNKLTLYQLEYHLSKTAIQIHFFCYTYIGYERLWGHSGAYVAWLRRKAEEVDWIALIWVDLLG